MARTAQWLQSAEAALLRVHEGSVVVAPVALVCCETSKLERWLRWVIHFNGPVVNVGLVDDLYRCGEDPRF